MTDRRKDITPGEASILAMAAVIAVPRWWDLKPQDVTEITKFVTDGVADPEEVQRGLQTHRDRRVAQDLISKRTIAEAREEGGSPDHQRARELLKLIKAASRKMGARPVLVTDTPTDRKKDRHARSLEVMAEAQMLLIGALHDGVPASPAQAIAFAEVAFRDVKSTLILFPKGPLRNEVMDLCEKALWGVTVREVPELETAIMRSGPSVLGVGDLARMVREDHPDAPDSLEDDIAVALFRLAARNEPLVLPVRGDRPGWFTQEPIIGWQVQEVSPEKARSHIFMQVDRASVHCCHVIENNTDVMTADEIGAWKEVISLLDHAQGILTHPRMSIRSTEELFETMDALIRRCSNGIADHPFRDSDWEHVSGIIASAEKTARVVLDPGIPASERTVEP